MNKINLCIVILYDEKNLYNIITRGNPRSSRPKYFQPLLGYGTNQVRPIQKKNPYYNKYYQQQ